jgi:Methylamine utilisation protein MauE
VSGMVDPAIACTLRAGFVLLFGGAVVHKLRAPRAFRTAVEGFGVVPAGVAGPVAALLVAAEVGVVAALVVAPAVGAAASAALLLGYATAMALALARGRRGIDCGCGGPGGGAPLQAGLVARNLVLVAMTLPLLAPVGDRALGWVDGLTVLGALASATALATAVSVLLASGPRLADLRRAAERP